MNRMIPFPWNLRQQLLLGTVLSQSAIWVLPVIRLLKYFIVNTCKYDYFYFMGLDL